MRIIATCDLHYNIARSRAPTEAAARDMCRAGGDVLLLLGDLAGTELSILEKTFALFESFRGIRAFVPGNHELWAPHGGDSLARYRDEIPAICRRHGVRMLDHEPIIDGDTAIVGTIGWYDYAFRSQRLGIPLRFYEHKVAPGTAVQRAEYNHLLGDDVPEHARGILCRHMDGQHVRWATTDAGFADTTVTALREHLQRVAGARRVLVGMHNLPFAELLPTGLSGALEFAQAFLGSPRFGEAILAHPNVLHVLCGHSHRYARHESNGMTAVAIGSTYVAKRYEIVEL